MKESRSNAVLKKILENIELPESAYKRAEKRYQDIGEWFHRPESACLRFDPNIFPQGSFRLGTAIKPDTKEHYDLDMGCNLRQGLTKDNITQEQLKSLVGEELEKYRKYRNIKSEMDEKRRCWRLEYADDMSFHLDIVPCIPEGDISRGTLKSRMIQASKLDEVLASRVAELAVSITDNEDAGYKTIIDDWRISNPEGYARWFESRMRKASTVLTEREMKLQASIDTLPYYRWKTPLQSAIQLLKRHRDTMFKGNEDGKPISVIITTLSAQAYNGESDLVSALSNILKTMDSHIQNQTPLVPNPVNPDEDFADKWYSKDHAHLKLQENFNRWLFQAQAHFAALCSKDNSRLILEAADSGFAVMLDQSSVDMALGLSAAVATPTKRIVTSDTRPWFEL